MELNTGCFSSRVIKSPIQGGCEGVVLHLGGEDPLFT